MIEPLRISFEVGCSASHAFEVWTSGIDTWWPNDHTVTGRSDLTVVIEHGVGGRIFERTSDGAEHDWGQVTLWDPPNRLAYRWHLGQDVADATEVDIRFLSQGMDSTRVEIEHRGWERLGVVAQERRLQNRTGWDSLLPYFVAGVTNATQKGGAR